MLAKWLTDPRVLEFYEGRDRPFNEEMVERKFFPEHDPEVRCLILYKDTPIGYIQYYELDQEGIQEYGLENSEGKIFGIDQFIGEADYWSKGMGTSFITMILTFLTKEMGADRVVLDPQASNIRAIRCYEKCGFKKAGVLPRHEFHEGDYRDCVLMEFLPSKEFKSS